MDLPIPICRESGLSLPCAVGNALFHGLALRLELLQHYHFIAGSGLNGCVRPWLLVPSPVRQSQTPDPFVSGRELGACDQCDLKSA